MTLSARHGAVSAAQGKDCLGVIKPVDLYPGPNRMTCFATKRSSVCAAARHAIIELTFVRVMVTSRAGAIFKFEGENLIRAAPGA